MSPTPRTDALADGTGLVPASFARTLELELADALTHVRDANKGARINAMALRLAVDQIKELRELLGKENKNP